MPPSYITIPRSDFLELTGEVRRSLQVCEAAANLRIALIAFERRLPESLKEKVMILILRHAVEACEEITKFRIELLSFERHLGEFVDQELTPVNPPGHNDSHAAFKAATDYAQGRKKAPPRG